MDDEQKARTALPAVLTQYMKAEALPESLADDFLKWYAGVTHHLATWANERETPPLVGISGCQGSGKSTLVQLMAHVLCEVHDVSVAVLSLDDFYLPKAARLAMGKTVHPLFATRGVPGTHDLALLSGTIDGLRSSRGTVSLPTFDKARDERTEMGHWRQVGAPAQLILLEGWCMGVTPQRGAELLAPVNRTEEEADADLIWRTEVNRQLSGDYADLFAALDALLVLQAPDFDAVFEWRWQQEQRLSEQFQRRHPDSADPTMGRDEVADFVLHYQRLTEHALRTLPDRANFVWELEPDRSVKRLRLTGVAA